MKSKNVISPKKMTYLSPDIEVVEIKFEQNILSAGSGTSDGLPDLTDDLW